MLARLLLIYLRVGSVLDKTKCQPKMVLLGHLIYFSRLQQFSKSSCEWSEIVYILASSDLDRPKCVAFINTTMFLYIMRSLYLYMCDSRSFVKG